MSEREDELEDSVPGLAGDVIYDVSVVAKPFIFAPIGDPPLEFRCDVFRLIFRRARHGEEPQFGFVLADMASGEKIGIRSEGFHGPEGVRLTITVPAQDAYALGDNTYSPELFKKILDSALTAYAKSEYDDNYGWTRISWSISFQREAPAVLAGPGIVETPSAAPEKDLYPTEISAPKPIPAKIKRKFRPLRFAGACIVGFFAFSILSVAIHRFVPVPITVLMIEKLAQGNGLDHRWVPAWQISDNLKRAVIASEDAKFCTHDGFDIQAIEKAERYNATHRKKRGASTISQQTAKNVFLWPDRSWIRKGFEVYYTFLIEHMWSKDRIMEVYLNSIEMGPGIYGAEAASQYWFGHSAATLSRAEAAQLAAILPNPIKRKAKGSKRSGSIAANARTVVSQGLDACAAE